MRRSRFAVGADHGDDRAFAQFVAGLGAEFQQLAGAARFDLHRRFIGFEFGDDIARADSVADLLQPIDQQAVHGEFDFVRHLQDLLHRIHDLLRVRQRQQFDVL